MARHGGDGADLCHGQKNVRAMEAAASGPGPHRVAGVGQHRHRSLHASGDDQSGSGRGHPFGLPSEQGGARHTFQLWQTLRQGWLRQRHILRCGAERATVANRDDRAQMAHVHLGQGQGHRLLPTDPAASKDWRAAPLQPFAHQTDRGNALPLSIPAGTPDQR